MSNSERNALILAVTGGIACGKSEVGRVLLEMGFAVYDADHIAHDLMEEGSPVFQQVVEHFGANILSESGKISRPVLGEIVFEDPAQRKALNNMVHPAVRKTLEDLISESRRKGRNTAVLIPLLFESGMDTLDWNASLCISSREDLMLQRLEKRGLGREMAEQRIRSQMQLGKKEKKADRTISNNGSLEELEQATRQAVECLLGER
jgi:dephospho-CoA kinase